MASEEPAVDEVADHVADQDVRLLYMRRQLRRRDAEVMIDEPRELAAVAAGQPDRDDAELLADVERAQHVRRVAARRQCERDVTLATERFQLLGEDLGVTVVVADARENR